MSPLTVSTETEAMRESHGGVKSAATKMSHCVTSCHVLIRKGSLMMWSCRVLLLVGKNMAVLQLASIPKITQRASACVSHHMTHRIPSAEQLSWR